MDQSKQRLSIATQRELIFLVVPNTLFYQYINALKVLQSKQNTRKDPINCHTCCSVQSNLCTQADSVKRQPVVMFTTSPDSICKVVATQTNKKNLACRKTDTLRQAVKMLRRIGKATSASPSLIFTRLQRKYCGKIPRGFKPNPTPFLLSFCLWRHMTVVWKGGRRGRTFHLQTCRLVRSCCGVKGRDESCVTPRKLATLARATCCACAMRTNRNWPYISLRLFQELRLSYFPLRFCLILESFPAQKGSDGCDMVTDTCS